MQVSIYPITPIDAVIGGTIRFAWSGNQSFKNRCIIKNNETNQTVYDVTIETFKFEHAIDLSQAKLTNGQKYNAFITVFDKDNKESDLPALGEPFYCLATPSFHFTNISEGQLIKTSSYNFQLGYTQENGELLNSWAVTLYNQSFSEIATSGIRYDTEPLSYTFDGFSNRSEYFIRATGTTINGIIVDTGYLTLSVTFDIRDVFSLLELTNRPNIGAIQLRSNIVSSEGHLEQDAVYIDNECLDLTNNSVSYTEGFLLHEDFSLVFIGYAFQQNEKISLFKGERMKGNLYYRIGKINSDEMKAYFELHINYNSVDYVIQSNFIPQPDASDKLGVVIVRQGNHYTINMKNITRED